METFIAIVVAIIAAIPPFLNWLTDKSGRSNTRRLIDETKVRIEVLEAWLRTEKLIHPDGLDTDSKKEVGKELNRLLMNYRELEPGDVFRVPTELQNLGFIRRGLLLYLPRSPKQWTIHVTFYLVLSLAVFFILGASIPEKGADPQFSHLLKNPMMLLALVPFGIVVLLLQQMAERIVRERRYSKGSS